MQHGHSSVGLAVTGHHRCSPAPQPPASAAGAAAHWGHSYHTAWTASWKQYLYIYHIFTQYLPFCKTISYLTISLPAPPPVWFFSCCLLIPSASFFSLLWLFCFLCFFSSSISRFLFSIEFFSFLPIFLSTVYIDEIGFFCSSTEDNHCRNCHLRAKIHITERKKYKRQGIKKK